MRPRWLISGALAATLMLAGIGAIFVLPIHRLEFQAIQLDGHQVAPASLPEVAPQPRLQVDVNRAVAARDWQLSLDGRPLPLPARSESLRRLDVTLPGPLPYGSRHTVEVFAGRAGIRLAFQIVPPLTATMEMRLYHLEAGAPANVQTTVRFSRPVADRAHALESLEVIGGQSSYSWTDPQTLIAVTAGLPLGGRAVAMLQDGIVGQDGSATQDFQSAGIVIPTTVTAVPPDHLVQMYYVNTPAARASFLAHLDRISMLSPGWYDANADGTLTGYARQEIIDAAHAHNIQVVPLVVNADVDPNVAHAILADPERRARLAANLVQEARRYGYAGFQLDFEQIRWSDGALYTALVEECARVLHAAQLSLSVAVIPRLAGDDAAAGTLLDYFRSWSGAYDFPSLARSADFLSIMTYDEHNGVTPPGPVSGIPWMRKALDFTLRGVPPNKATLGLPTYYHDWTGVGHLTSSSYQDALILAQRYGVTPVFDPVEDEMHFTYQRNGVTHELWYENGDTLRRKLPLMHEYGLRGISVWRLGFEDAAFWDLIPPRQ